MPSCPTLRQLIYFCVVLGSSKLLHHPTFIPLPLSLALQPSNNKMLNMLKALQSKLDEAEAQRKKDVEEAEARRKRDAEEAEVQRKKEAERVEAQRKMDQADTKEQKRKLEVEIKELKYRKPCSLYGGN